MCHARVDVTEEGPGLVKTWRLRRDWIPEGERFALETYFTKQEIAELVACSPKVEDEEDEEEEEGEENVDDEEDMTEDEELEEDIENEVKTPDEQESDDEHLSENEDTSEDHSDAEEDDEDDNPVIETDSCEVLGVSQAPFLVFTDLAGTVYIKTNMQCR